MLKGAGLADMQSALFAMSAFTAAAVILAMLRYKRTLD
jgi:hypothetical protein